MSVRNQKKAWTFVSSLQLCFSVHRWHLPELRHIGFALFRATFVCKLSRMYQVSVPICYRVCNCWMHWTSEPVLARFAVRFKPVSHIQILERCSIFLDFNFVWHVVWFILVALPLSVCRGQCRVHFCSPTCRLSRSFSSFVPNSVLAFFSEQILRWLCKFSPDEMHQRRS